MTDCERAKRELEEYLHNELCSEDAADIRAHIEACDECSGEHNVGLALTQALKSACREAAPEDLRTQVLAKLRALQADHEPSTSARTVH